MRSRWKTAFCVKCNKDQPLVHNPSKGPKFVCAVCRDPVRLPNARGANPTRSKHTGAMFQSQEESKREPDLLALEQGGAISELRMTAWRSRPTTRYRLDVYNTQAVDALILALARDQPHSQEIDRLATDVIRSKHHVTTYTPDAEYRLPAGGELVVEDVKSGSGRRGAGDPTFSMKRKLMLACHGIEVRVIRGSGKPIFGKRTG